MVLLGRGCEVDGPGVTPYQWSNDQGGPTYRSLPFLRYDFPAWEMAEINRSFTSAADGHVERMLSLMSSGRMWASFEFLIYS